MGTAVHILFCLFACMIGWTERQQACNDRDGWVGVFFKKPFGISSSKLVDGMGAWRWGNLLYLCLCSLPVSKLRIGRD